MQIGIVGGDFDSRGRLQNPYPNIFEIAAVIIVVRETFVPAEHHPALP
jgi:hypothetical protein